MIEAIFALLAAFLIGMVLGSFVNSLVWRLRQGITLFGRSECPECRVTIRAHHLIPVISWIILEGKCAECDTRINFQYPLVEFLSGMIAMVVMARYFPFSAGFIDISLALFELFFALTLLTLAVFDWRWKLLPIEFMVGAALLFGGWNGLMSQSLQPLILGAAFGAVFLGLQVILSGGRWMGAGDPWLGALLGAGLGWPNVGVGMYLTYLLGGFFVFVLLLLGVVKRGSRIPFAPLLAIGGIGALWFGESIGLWFARAIGIA
jgi:leader peptidase (prepilin peptidase)/N-methyltransferase